MEDSGKKDHVDFSVEWLLSNGFIMECGRGEYFVLKRFILKNISLENEGEARVFEGETLTVSETFVFNIFAQGVSMLYKDSLKVYFYE